MKVPVVELLPDRASNFEGKLKQKFQFFIQFGFGACQIAQSLPAPLPYYR